ncbi:MAG: hypothetical protein QOH54_5952 [Mycobacterium sp.]|jgi:hypothetical protein|nr:hypothetical protein [Mycobacterium sp.]
MKLAALHLRQRDAVTCGPAVAVVAGALLDPAYRKKLTGRGEAGGAAGRAWFDGEQGRVHDQVNRLWPRRLGTTPMGVARAMSAHAATYGVRYGWRLCRGRRDAMADVVAEVDADWPVAMLVGRLIPRHWVLIVETTGDALRCYEPSSGEVRSVDVAAVRGARLRGLGFPRAFAFVLPRRP